MIFENALSDHDEPNDVQVKSPPTSLNLSQSPKTPSIDQQQGTKITRVRQRSLPISTSPPAMINRPQSVRKPGERLLRQVSVPARQHPPTTLQQQSLTSPTPTQGKNYIASFAFKDESPFFHLFTGLSELF
jgi:hypothetical protein